ncbi:RNase adapter RapZ, partial [Candidatus Magnetaquicoccus inordinatus]|uniref:RNase adapter RapZ n=1 Tax=Candidatus Magnetaquicoccus inordinatus TaxID=2496818 RepID=UPI00102C3159
MSGLAEKKPAEGKAKQKKKAVLPISHLVLLTGLSGAGKSIALKYLEDLGFYWTDNLPISLIPAYLQYLQGTGEEVIRVAVGIHLREGESLSRLQSDYQRIAEWAVHCELLFFEANPETLVNRYQETRRRHPLTHGCTVREAILLERQAMEPVRAMADLVIDTSRTTTPQLKDRLAQLFHEMQVERRQEGELTIFLRSFGFKYGANTDADMVLDGRFLPNPYYDPALRPYNGREEPVIRFLERDGEALAFLDRLQSLFDYLIPRYQKEKKRYFTVDIGCTGGYHRSVFLVEQLSQRLQQQGFMVLLRHRDLHR